MRWKIAAGVAAMALGLVACTPDFAAQDQSSVLLRVVKVTGQPGAGADTTESDFLMSDVNFKGGVFNDNMFLQLEVIAKNPSLVLGTFNDVLVQRYGVVYRRSDGRNTEGIDVPYAISGPMTALIKAGGTPQKVGLLVVRHQAKLEPPLLNLTVGGGAQVLTVIAEITIHGTTTSGKAVQAVGFLQISFADFGDSTT